MQGHCNDSKHAFFFSFFSSPLFLHTARMTDSWKNMASQDFPAWFAPPQTAGTTIMFCGETIVELRETHDFMIE